MYRNYNPNPIAARVGDCSVRALCKATNRNWQDVYMDIALLGLLMCDMPSSNAVWGAYLRKNGWRRYAIPNECPDCYSVSDFGRDHPGGTFVLCTNGHVLTMVNGDWFDTWDSGNEIPTFYWHKE